MLPIFYSILFYLSTYLSAHPVQSAIDPAHLRVLPCYLIISFRKAFKSLPPPPPPSLLPFILFIHLCNFFSPFSFLYQIQILFSLPFFILCSHSLASSLRQTCSFGFSENSVEIIAEFNLEPNYRTTISPYNRHSTTTISCLLWHCYRLIQIVFHIILSLLTHTHACI